MPGSALGILRRDEVHLFEAGLGGGEAMARFARGPQTLLIVKTDRHALVHRRGAMDCVIVKTLDADGRATGERRFAGLFTSTAYHTPVLDVPLLRDRVEQVLRRAGLDPNSHDGKALLAILDAYPRDELFQIDPTRSTTMRSASCSSRSGAGWRCSCAAIPSAASRAAWCSRRASASTRR